MLSNFRVYWRFRTTENILAGNKIKLKNVVKTRLECNNSIITLTSDDVFLTLLVLNADGALLILYNIVQRQTTTERILNKYAFVLRMRREYGRNISFGSCFEFDGYEQYFERNFTLISAIYYI